MGSEYKTGQAATDVNATAEPADQAPAGMTGLARALMQKKIAQRRAAGPMRVNTNGVRVRSSPDKHTDANIVGRLSENETVEVTEPSGEWVQIERHGKPAFAFGRYLTPTKHGTASSTLAAGTPAVASPIEVAAPADAVSSVAHDPSHVDNHASEQHASEKHAHHGKKTKAEKPTRYTKYGGGRVKTVLAKLVQERGLQTKISGRDIAQLDGLSEVETGGNVAAVDTTDDEVVSIGFHQIVLGDLSIQEVMEKIPDAFAKHGLKLDKTATYDVKSKPFRIEGVEHHDTLRTREWGDKFYAASAEPDVILAIAEYALREKKLVGTITEKSGGNSDWFQDITAETWLLEMHNSRPGWLGAVVKRALANNADAAKTRDEFLNILASSMIDVYGEKEPIREFHAQKSAAAKAGTPLDDAGAAALKASIMDEWTSIGRTKAEHITTKISRSMVPVQLDPAAPNATASPATPAPKVAPLIAARQDEHHDEHHVAAPATKPIGKAPQPAPTPPAAAQATSSLGPITPEPPHAQPTAASAPFPGLGAHVAPTPVAVTHTLAPASAVASLLPQSTLAPVPVPATHLAGNLVPVHAQAIHKTIAIPGLPTVQAYVPATGVKGPVEVFLFLHGMFAHSTKGKTADPHPEEDMHLARATAESGRNIVTLAPTLPGEFPNWQTLASKKGGKHGEKTAPYRDLIQGALDSLQEQLHPAPNPALSIGTVSVAGHSAGSIGLGDAATQLGDDVHDVTVEDGGYESSKLFTDSHREIVEWLLSGDTEKLLRVIVRANIKVQKEADILKKYLNKQTIEDIASSPALRLEGVTVSTDGANHDARSIDKMYLYERLHVHGLKTPRSVSVFNMAGEDASMQGHWNVRNKATQRLLHEGQDTDFLTNAADTSVKPEAGPDSAAATASAGITHGSGAAHKAVAKPTGSVGPASLHSPALRSDRDGAAPHAAQQAHPQVETAKRLAESGSAILPGETSALHDGGADHELGSGDEVIESVRGHEHITPAFSPTPEGMVMAAMYELHRGDKRSMAEIMADHAASRWQRGKDAATEQTVKGDWKHGRGLNDDGNAALHGQVVGHVQKAPKKGQLVDVPSPIGPIQAYKTASGMGTFSQGRDPMWCGAFVTYCLARCGITPGTLQYVPSIGSTIAKAGGTLFQFDYKELDDGGGDIHKAKYSYGGGYSETKPGESQKKLAKKHIDNSEGIDIRPGDVFYSHKHTGIIVDVNKTEHGIVLRTIEGNSNDKVISNVKTITVDKKGVVTDAPFLGWGRVAEFGKFAAPVNEDWVDSGKGKKHDEGKTT